jgi:transposase
MESLLKLRRKALVKGEPISRIARDLNLSRNTVKKYLKAEMEPVYQRSHQPCPKLGKYRQQLETWLEQDGQRPKGQRRTARRLYEDLQREGYAGAYDSVQRFVKHWKGKAPTPACDAYVPLSFPPGETCQFDWSHEQVELGGVVQTVKLAHFRLAHSRQTFLAAYPRETQEMVFDAHNRAFAFFGGVPERMVYDNPKTIVQAIYAGKERQFNRRFLALASHYLFEPVACTPASGWEKGQVENQVGNVREWLFTPRPSFADFSALNAWLEVRCRELAKRPHPEQKDRPIAEVFTEEQARLRPIAAPFDGYFEQPCRVSSTCLVSYDRNRYSVPAEFAGQRVSPARLGGSNRGGGRRPSHRRACPQLRAGTVDPRPLALPAGAGTQTWGPAPWRPLPGLGTARAHPRGEGTPAETAPGRPGLRGGALGPAGTRLRDPDRGL